MRLLPALLLALAAASTGCSTLGAMAGAVVRHSLPGRSSPVVQCQSGPDGEPQCYEYAPGARRSGDPAPVGADPYASIGESANATATPLVGMPSPAQLRSSGGWPGPLAPPSEPLPALTTR